MAQRKKMKVLYLETQLDKNIESKRSQIGFVKELIPILTDGSVEIIAKEVHSKGDLQKFLRYARRDPDIRYIHFGGHGRAKAGACSIYLTGNEEINLKHKRHLEIFKNLKEKVIFFSCCQIGSDSEAMDNLLRISKAWAICAHCGAELSPSHVGPCPSCGKEGRNINVSIKETIKITSSLHWEAGGSIIKNTKRPQQQLLLSRSFRLLLVWPWLAL